MPLGQQISQFLNASLGTSAPAQRNRKIIECYYGLDELTWPSLEQVGEAFDEITRERVRQIKKKFFLTSVTSDDLPSLLPLVELIKSSDVHLVSELLPRIIDEQLIEEDLELADVIRILNEIGDLSKYALYDGNLEAVTRYSIDDKEQVLLIAKNSLVAVRKLSRELHKLVGQVGIVNFDVAVSETGEESDSHASLVETIIINSADVWLSEMTPPCFTFETWQNPLTTNLGKSFSVTDSINAIELSEVIKNSFSARTRKIKYPTLAQIDEYLRTSDNFVVEINDFISLSPDSDISQGLSDIEEAASKYLIEHGTSQYPELHGHLKNLGFGDPYIVKGVFHLPVVFVDKEGGRYHYRYSAVGAKKVDHPVRSTPYAKYKKYRARLKKLIANGSDTETLSLARKEQSVLRDWLTEGKDQLECAFCQRTFPVIALVAAHKKRRSECTEDERADPYIVMPLCALGCDFIYEKRFVRIVDGKIKVAANTETDGDLSIIIGELSEREVSEQWLLGSSEYFDGD